MSRDLMVSRIFALSTNDLGVAATVEGEDMLAHTLKIKGVFGDTEVLGIMSVTHTHAKHVDHGWVHRYVLLINGIVLAERLIKSDVAKAYGGPIMSGAAEIGRVVKVVHKGIVKHGYHVPEVAGGEGHSTD